MRIPMKTTAQLALLLLVAAAGAVALAGEDEDKEERHVLIERLRHGDCPQMLRLGEHGHGLMHLGSYGYLGVGITSLTPELREHFGVPDDLGVMVSRVEEGSPAEAAGLQVGDIVTRIDDEDVTSSGRLQRLIRHREKDEVVTVEYWRDGRAATATATLGEHQRCGLDLSSLIDLEHLPHFDLEDLPHFELEDLPQLDLEDLPRFEHFLELQELDGEALGEAMERMREALESQDWESHLERLREIDLSHIEERLQEVMERLHELEAEIEIEKKRVQEDEGESEL